MSETGERLGAVENRLGTVETGLKEVRAEVSELRGEVGGLRREVNGLRVPGEKSTEENYEFSRWRNTPEFRTKPAG